MKRTESQEPGVAVQLATTGILLTNIPLMILVIIMMMIITIAFIPVPQSPELPTRKSVNPKR